MAHGIILMIAATAEEIFLFFRHTQVFVVEKKKTHSAAATQAYSAIFKLGVLIIWVLIIVGA